MQRSYAMRGDVFGGITAAVVALPLGLAFGVASGLGAAAGLYGAIIIGFFASLFGGTKTQISGPTGPMTVVMASSVVALDGEPALIAAVVLLSGVFQIAFSFARIGKYVRYIPYPVISGFMSGIGVIIILLQINPFLGLQGSSDTVEIIKNLPHAFANAQLDAALLALATLGIMFFTPAKIAKLIPTPLIALLILTPAGVYMGLDIATIGAIPTGLPDFVLPSLDAQHYKTIITLALTLALLGSIDTLLTSLVADSMTQTKHDSDRELFGQGIGNALCSFAGAIPGAGATMRTVVNIKSGGRSKASGMIHAVTLLLIVVFFAPFAAQIPLAVLAGILVKVGLDILDYKFLKVIKTAPRNDLLVMLSVFFVTVFIDLITAVGVGIVLASLLIVYRITRQTKITTTSTQERQDVHINDPHTHIVTIDGAFFFGSATAFEREIHSILDTKKVVIDCLRVPFIDITAIFTLQELIERFHESGIEVVLLAKL
ncbi:MAG: SulP family inorganic anion transporter, partial [Campylobacterota bacterium]